MFDGIDFLTVAQSVTQERKTYLPSLAGVMGIRYRIQKCGD